MTGSRNVTAGFGLGPGNNGPMAKVVQTGYDSVANAYSAAGAGSTILALAGNHSVGTLTLDQGNDVTIKGGYDSLFLTPGLPTVLQGVLYIRSGSLRVDNVRIQATQE
jgi:hypothetical protein